MIFSSVYVADWPPYGKELHVLFVLCLFVFSDISLFGFEAETLVLIAPVPGHVIPFYLKISLTQEYTYDIMTRVEKQGSEDQKKSFLKSNISV